MRISLGQLYEFVPRFDHNQSDLSDLSDPGKVDEKNAFLYCKIRFIFKQLKFTVSSQQHRTSRSVRSVRSDRSDKSDNLNQFDFEGEGLTGKWVVGIKCNRGVAEIDHHYDSLLAVGKPDL